HVVVQSETVFTLFRGIHPSAANLLHHHGANDCLFAVSWNFCRAYRLEAGAEGGLWPGPDQPSGVVATQAVLNTVPRGEEARTAGCGGGRTKPVALLPSRQS